MFTLSTSIILIQIQTSNVWLRSHCSVTRNVASRIFAGLVSCQLYGPVLHPPDRLLLCCCFYFPRASPTSGAFRRTETECLHMSWYAYCIGEKQAFPELGCHRKPIPMESLLGVSGNQVFVYPASELAVIVSEHNPSEALNQKSGVDHARGIADRFQH